MFLAGTFSEYPFGELLEIFLHKRETGLLEVSSPQQCGHFYIRNGEIKNGVLGKLRGVAAIELAGTLEDGSFKFKRLDSTEYAQVVWQESFGLSNVTAESDSVSVRCILKHVPSYSIEAYSVLENAVLWLGQRALTPLLIYLGSAYRSLEKAGVLIARRMSSYVNAKYVGFSRWAKHTKTPVPLVPPMLSERQPELRRYLALGQEPRLALGRGQYRNAVALRGEAAREYPREFVHSETHTTLPRFDTDRLQHGFPTLRAKARYFEIPLKQARVLNLKFRRCLVLTWRRSVVLLSLSTIAFTGAVQKLRPYGATAARNLRNVGNLTVRRTLVYAMTVWQSLKRVQVRRRLLPAFWRAEAAWQIGLGRTKQIIFKTARMLTFQNTRTLIKERRAQTNTSFALILLVLLVGTTVSITKILRNNDQPNNVISTKEESAAAPPKATRKAPRRRVKRTKRSGKQRPNKTQNTETAVF